MAGMRSVRVSLLAISLAALAASPASADSPVRDDRGETIGSFAIERASSDAFFVALTTSAGATYSLATGRERTDGAPGITSPPGSATKVVLARSPGGDLQLAYASADGAVTTFFTDVGAPPSWEARDRRESAWGARGALALTFGARTVIAMSLTGNVQVGDVDGPRGAFDTPEATGEAVLGRLGDRVVLVYPTRGGARVEYLTSDGRPSGDAPTRVAIAATGRALEVVATSGGALLVARSKSPLTEPTQVVRLDVDGTVGPARELPAGTVGLVADAFSAGGPDVHVLRYENARLTDTSWNALERATAGAPAVGANLTDLGVEGPMTGACNERACLFGALERRTNLRTFEVRRGGEVTTALLTPPASTGPGSVQYGPTNACAASGAPDRGMSALRFPLVALGLALAAGLVRRRRAG